MMSKSDVRVKRSWLLRLNGRSDLVFSLFDPIGEKKWAETWNPTLVFPDSAVRQGSVFTTKDHEGTETIWTITKLDKKNRKIVYAAVTPGFKVSIIDINCQPDGTNRTKARVTYTITALSEKGKEYVTSMSMQHYHAWMTGWEKAINHYLRWGRALQHH